MRTCIECGTTIWRGIRCDNCYSRYLAGRAAQQSDAKASVIQATDTVECVDCGTVLKRRLFTDEATVFRCTPCWKLHSALSKDAPLEVTPQGGKHSKIGMAFHHLDAGLMLTLASILYQGGAKYGRNNWKNISVEDHLNHALTHIFGFLSGDTQDDHLSHAILRVMFAEIVRREGGPYVAAS